jgi:haloacetate dehalogenase
MFDAFEAVDVQTDETTIFLRRSGTGPAVLMLHGFPQTHLMWREVAPQLADGHTVICVDLRGYGRSGCPPSTDDHAPYSKQAMAREMVAVMAQLGFSRFAVAGHDRGGRVAYRLALDYPERVDPLAVLMFCRLPKCGSGPMPGSPALFGRGRRWRKQLHSRRS